MILGTCQLNVCKGQEELKPWLDKIASHQDPGFWLFPELVIGGFEYEQKTKWSSLTANILKSFASFSKDTGHGLGAGLWRQEGDKFFNAFYLMLPNWARPGCIYKKIHLFPLSREEQEFYPGLKSPQPIKWEKMNLGFAICFDLRFPELFRYQNSQEVDIFLVPAQWPLKRLAHWQTLLKARAIENQSYFLACNACGPSGLGELAGHSCLIDPWGETVFGLETSPGLRCSQLDLQNIKKAKSLFQTGHSDFFTVQTDKDLA